MAVTAPTGNVYVFDNALFSITGTGMFVLNIGGASIKASAINGAVSINAKHILQQLFTISDLRAVHLASLSHGVFRRVAQCSHPAALQPYTEVHPLQW